MLVPAGFDKGIDRWAYWEMIEEHQRSVWTYQPWPRSL